MRSGTVDFQRAGGTGLKVVVKPLTVRDEFSRYLLELRRVPNARSQTVRKKL